jgi:hypothetical protein
MKFALMQILYFVIPFHKINQLSRRQELSFAEFPCTRSLIRVHLSLRGARKSAHLGVSVFLSLAAAIFCNARFYLFLPSARVSFSPLAAKDATSKIIFDKFQERRCVCVPCACGAPRC